MNAALIKAIQDKIDYELYDGVVTRSYCQTCPKGVKTHCRSGQCYKCIIADAKLHFPGINFYPYLSTPRSSIELSDEDTGTGIPPCS